MTDTEFLANLEACRMPVGAFNHAAHVRLAYLCLREQEFAAALVRVRGLIKNYANSIGKGSLYDETITRAHLELIQEHLRSRGDAGGWDAPIAVSAKASSPASQKLPSDAVISFTTTIYATKIYVYWLAPWRAAQSLSR